MSDSWYPYDDEEEVPLVSPPGSRLSGLDASTVPPPSSPSLAPAKEVDEQNSEMQLSTTSGPNSHPIFAAPGNSQDIYRNTTLSGFPVAGQQKDGALVEALEFRASMVTKEDGVQYNMYAGWKNRGETGVNSRDLKWFEKRDGKSS